MSDSRRDLMKRGVASIAAAGLAPSARAPAEAAPADQPIHIEPNPGYFRIACKEAWTTQEVVEQIRRGDESAWSREHG